MDDNKGHTPINLTKFDGEEGWGGSNTNFYIEVRERLISIPSEVSCQERFLCDV